MAELFIELFSEEIPSKLQIDARQRIRHMLEERLQKKEIQFNSSKSFSTPKRLVFVIDGIPEKIEQKKKVLKGPKVGAPQVALDGFIKSNNLNKAEIYKKNIEKGEFYFANTKPKVINIINEFEFIIPEVLQGYSWKKSMKWSVYDLSWGRPLKSIIALFNNKVINFNFFHLQSNNLTFADETNGEKQKKVNNFKSYLSILKSKNIVLDQEKRKIIIVRKFNNICNSRKLKNNFNEKFLIVNKDDQQNLPAGGDRYFKLMIDPYFGSKYVTQFLGYIKKIKAPFHEHTYDEVIYILQGEGIVHHNNSKTQIKKGSSVYLPPGTIHRLENKNKDIELLILKSKRKSSRKVKRKVKRKSPRKIKRKVKRKSPRKVKRKSPRKVKRKSPRKIKKEII